MFNFYSAENFPHRLEERVKESANTQTEQLPKALQLDDVGSQARHNAPDVVKTEAREVDSAQDGCGDCADSGDDPVTPVLGGYKGAEAGSPHTINTVRTIRLGKHVLKKNL